MFVRGGAPFNYDVEEASVDSGLDCSVEPSLTKQSFADEADINNIVRRFSLTGQLPTDLAVPQYGDFVDVVDYHSAMLQVRKSQEAFMELPAQVRSRFHNDPGELVDFVSDDKNRAEAEKLGIVLPKAVEPPVVPVKVEVVPTSGSVVATSGVVKV